MISESEYFDDLSWHVLNQNFKENQNTFLVKHLIDTFNDFVFQKLDQIIEGFNTVDMHYTYLADLDDFQQVLKIRISNPVLSKPMIHETDGSTKVMTPEDARARNFTYAGTLFVDMDILARSYNPETREFTTQSKKINGLSIGKLPIMVRSNYCVLNTAPQHAHDMGECPYDYGGYFIVNGNEKVVISQDRIAENKPYVFLNSKATTYSHIVEIRSVNDNVFSVPKITTIKLSSKPNQHGRYIKASIHHVKHDIPLFVLFRALGVESDKDIINHICLGSCDNERYTDIVRELVGSADDGNFVVGHRDALDYMLRYLNVNGHPKEFMANRQYKMNVLQKVLHNEFLPHVGPDLGKKALYLGYMVNKLIKCFLGKMAMDDRDSYINKRVDTPGILMANLFRQYYGKLIKDMRNMVQKEINNGSWRATNNFINVINKVNINKVLKSTIIESGLKYGLATGNWGIKTNKTKQGVAQVLNRMTYNATISHLRRINTPIEKSGKIIPPRKLHATQWGVVCPCETPEGSSVGLVKNLALMTNLTSMSCSKHVRKCVEDLGLVKTCVPREIEGRTLVVVNGDIVGYHADPASLVTKLRQMKMQGGINPFTSIFWKHNTKEVYICTEAGRCVRPLFTVSEPGNRPVIHDIADEVLHGLKTWNEILLSGAIEYIDVEESNAAMIAMRYADLFKTNNVVYSHLEMHPSLILGVLAGSIPFSDHNQAPRNTYQCLWEEEPVLMEDGTRKAIKDVRVGERVVTFDPETMQPSYTSVVHQYVRPTDKTIVKVTTETGREIVVTDDHLFMTNRGWVPARQLMEDGVRVGVSIHPSKTYERKLNDDYEAEAELLTTHNITASDACVLARLIGYRLGGGNNTPSHPTDAELFRADMLRVAHCFETLAEAAISKGKIPAWIAEQKSYAREFIAGFHGATMTALGFVRVFADNPALTQAVFNLMLKTDLHLKMWIVPEGYRITEFDAYMDRMGVRYNTTLLQVLGLRAEYAKYCMHHANESSIEVATFVEWSQDTPVRHHSQFQRVLSIVVQNNCLIADITTESENHSFVGGRGGFMVHNSAMGKQAIGLYSTNFRNRYDSVGHTLNYPQKPIVYTRTSQVVNVDKLPCGVNVIVAIATYTGFNQEDSLILNKSSVDRGLFQSTVYRTYKDQNNKNHSTGEEEVYGNPTQINVSKLKPYNYSKLSDDGFVPENTCVNGQDVIIGKAMPQKVNGAIVHKDMSVPLKNNETCFIDRNCTGNKHFTNVNGDGYTFSKVRVRSDRIPTIGDKLSSRHGQKGTCGMAYRQEDMPFTKDGLVPDIIMNPHAVPSRMTIGQLMECIMGKSCVVKGTRGDGTPFTEVKVEELADILESCGLERYGNEILYNSRTGEMMETEIFMGPTYYQRLKHLVNDKVHSRSNNGPVVMMTRQPAEGRARDGGLRLGEMEVECKWAHGCMQFTKERFMECSDNYRMHICKQCGMPATAANPDKNIWLCKSCRNTTDFREIRIPYACKLLLQEAQTMNIAARFTTV